MRDHFFGMRGWRQLLLVAVLFCAIALPAASPVQAQGLDRGVGMPEYLIGPGDELSITFPYNAELNHDGPVGPDGRFTMPQLGNIALAHTTIDEATALISDELRRAGIVEDARPSVTIRTYGASVFVGGEVRSPGSVRLTGGMDALQAVIAAGGLLDTARSKKVVVIRRDDTGTPTLHYVDLRNYVRRGLASGAAPLLSQDIVFVPKSSIAEVNLWVDQYINKLIPFNKGINYNIGGGGVNPVIGK